MSLWVCDNLAKGSAGVLAPFIGKELAIVTRLAVLLRNLVLVVRPPLTDRVMNDSFGSAVPLTRSPAQRVCTVQPGAQWTRVCRWLAELHPSLALWLRGCVLINDSFFSSGGVCWADELWELSESEVILVLRHNCSCTIQKQDFRFFRFLRIKLTCSSSKLVQKERFVHDSNFTSWQHWWSHWARHQLATQQPQTLNNNPH